MGDFFKNRKLWVVVSLWGIAALGLLSLAVWKPPSFLKVQEIVLETPVKHISEKDLMRLAEVKKGQNLLLLSLRKVRANLLRYPWIREVELSKKMPGRLILRVEEQVPVVLVEMPSKPPVYYLMNHDGRAFKKAEAKDLKDLPLLTGFSEESLGRQTKSLLELLDQFDQSADLGAVGVSELHWNSARGLSLFTKDPGIRVDMGPAGWTDRLKTLEKAWGTIRHAAKKPKVIDLSLEDKIVVKE